MRSNLSIHQEAVRTSPELQAPLKKQGQERVMGDAYSSAVGYDGVQIASGSKPGAFYQPKLRINTPNDRYEQEADQIAEQLIGGTTPTSAGATGVQQKNLAAQISRVSGVAQRKTSGTTATQASGGLTQQIQSKRSGGRALDAQTQRFMSSRMGTDLSGVRIHTGGEAARMSEQVNARAFTVGQNIFFNSGEYQPSSEGGRRLLAHELVHTVQQGAGNSGNLIQKDDKPKKKEKKDKVQVVAKTDAKEGPSLELKAKKKVSKGITNEASAKMSGKKEEVKAGSTFSLGRTPFSLTGGMGGTRDLSTLTSTPFFHLRLSGEGQPTDFMSLDGNASVKYKPGKTPAVSLDGRVVFVPDYLVAPYLTGAVDFDQQKTTFGAGARLRLGKGMYLNTTLLGNVGFDGNFVPGVSIGLTLPISWLSGGR